MIERDEFRSWLASLPPNSVVGHTWSITDNPVVRYLYLKTGKHYESFHDGLLKQDQELSWLPEEMLRYEEKLDGDLQTGKVILAHEALAVLDSLGETNDQ